MRDIFSYDKRCFFTLLYYIYVCLMDRIRRGLLGCLAEVMIVFSRSDFVLWK